MKTINYSIITGLFLCALSATATQPHKMQDADYVKIVCDAKSGQTEVRRLGSRADCVSENEAIEVEYAHKWSEGIGQAERYGKVFSRKPVLVLVLEQPDHERFVELANQQIRRSYSPIKLEVYKNFRTKQASLNLIDGPIVKLSRSGICHVKNVGAYGQTQYFTPFSSLKECEKHGRLPKNVGLDLLESGEREAIKAATFESTEQENLP